MSSFDLDHIFMYHPPGPKDGKRYSDLRVAARQFAKVILANTPSCADQSDAIRKVREAVMTANAAVALGGRLHHVSDDRLEVEEEQPKSLTLRDFPDEVVVDLTKETSAVREMLLWFVSIYEDPVENCPHDSGEGGFQYIYGGPYDADDELAGHFTDASEKDVERATELLRSSGTTAWSKQPTEEMTR